MWFIEPSCSLICPVWESVSDNLMKFSDKLKSILSGQGQRSDNLHTLPCPVDLYLKRQFHLEFALINMQEHNRNQNDHRR